MTKKSNLLNEENFHDEWARSVNLEDIHPIEFFTVCTAPENRWIMKNLGDIKGLKILELGCGLGEASVYLSLQGAQVFSTDLSEEMLNTTSKLAQKYNTAVTTRKCSADKIDFPDESFDIVYAANLLHHVDIEQTLAEAKRVLVPGGRFVSWDPIAHNPVINIYRKMAKEVRTEDEHPLKMKELNTFKKYFKHLDWECTWFFTLIIFLKFYFIDKVGVNQERYWKKIISEHKALEPLYTKLERWDTKFLKVFPFMKRFCWNIAIIAKK